MIASMLWLALLAVQAAPTIDTRDFHADAKGVAKVVWDDHWYEVNGGQIWLVQRLTYKGDWRFYDRVSLPGLFDNRRLEAGERQGDDCRKVGIVKVCRHTENVRVSLSRAEVEKIAASPDKLTLTYQGMTRDGKAVAIDPAEARALLAKMNGGNGLAAGS